MFIDTNLLIYALIGIIAILTILVIRLEFRIKRLMSGKNGRSLESAIFGIKEGVTRLDNLHYEMRQYVENIEGRVKKSVRRAETVRFNPFKGTGNGGNQSFATALLDEDGNGVILSSLYSRERVSVFAKPIENYSSEYELSSEEKEAIEKVRI